MLRPGRRAALRWAELIDGSDVLDLYQPPELDIVTYLPRVPVAAAATPSLRRSTPRRPAVMQAGMADRSAFLATYAVTPAALQARGHRRRGATSSAAGSCAAC